MKKKRFTEKQVIGILRQAERGEQTIGEICQAHGVSEQSFYRWRQKYGGRRMGQAKLDLCPLSALLGPAKMLRYYICALSYLAPPLSLSLFGCRCPHAREANVTTVITPRTQAYLQSQRSWGIGSSPSGSRGHVGPASCTDGPATHRLRIPDPTRPGVFTTWLKARLKQ